MKIWSVPESYEKKIPKHGEQGSFWENRGDRYHCGVDIYAPESSDVLAISEGEVIETGIFTSPKEIPYWNITYYILIKHKTDLLFKYAELKNILVSSRKSIKKGQVIGQVGKVLNIKKINEASPLYIQKLKQKKDISMLHLEAYSHIPAWPCNYSGGNIFIPLKPDNLLDPSIYLPG